MNPTLAAPALVAPVISFQAIGPVLVLAITALALLVLDLLPPRDRKEHLGVVGLAGIVGSLVVSLYLWGADERAFKGMVILDGFAIFFNLVIGFGVGLVLLQSLDYARRQGAGSGEFYILVILAAVGMTLMAGAGDLIVVFLGLETMSLALYVLAGSFRGRIESGEASMKYFLLGAFASGFFLYGIALVYGATGSTNIDRIAAAIGSGSARDPLLVVGFGLLVVGFGFKISTVPFHMWVSDVYQGAPTSITVLIATGSKAAAFAALMRVLLVALRQGQADWALLMWGLAVLSMTVGNVVAIAQQNVKRMLAYSSVAHVGYILVGVVAGGAPGNAGVLFYLLAYTFTTAGAFGVVLLLERSGREAVETDDFAGLATRHPVIALVMTIFLLSLVGIPPTAGFVGKFYLFGAAVRSGYVWLAVLGVLNSAIAAYYYLRIVVVMYMREPEGAPTTLVPSWGGSLALLVALCGVVWLGVMPAPYFDLAQTALAPLLR
ncbi:MAG TPA: NADH-quinone oxidoreductase subunit N [Candidatus Nitrosocosmicus sp.]|jgi:NADH-quinone oxidoreductase subunit N|nr:NADH-quinone oxidoreductase subunit N [Candidatus Nitrosocosmicus sp.]